jgi:hypothetical protein
MEVVEAGGLLAIAVFAHAWVHRITGPAQVLNVCGWVVAVLFTVLVCSRFVHCN